MPLPAVVLVSVVVAGRDIVFLWALAIGALAVLAWPVMMGAQIDSAEVVCGWRFRRHRLPLSRIAEIHVARIAAFGVRGSDGYGLVVIADDGVWFPIQESRYCGQRRLTGWAATLGQASGCVYNAEDQTFRPDADDHSRWRWAA